MKDAIISPNAVQAIPTPIPVSARGRPLGVTTGTFLRPPQHLGEAFGAFDLRAEADLLLGEARYLPDRRSAKTLIKLPHLRVTLTAACAGTSTNTHTTRAALSVQCLSGLILLRAGDAEVELDQAGLATIEAEVEYEIKAVTDAVFLVTLAWTTEAKEQAEAAHPATSTPSPAGARITWRRMDGSARRRRVVDEQDRPKVAGFKGSYM